MAGTAGVSCGGRYPLGQCTAGAAAMFPSVCPPTPNLGNGGDWFRNAQGLGWPAQAGKAVPGWLASFNVDPPYGDVGYVVSVQGDTLTRLGTNWHLNGEWSQDSGIPVDNVIGSFQPPGAFVPPPGYTGPGPAQLLSAQGTPQAMLTAQQQGSAQQTSGARGGPCQFGWQFQGFSIPLPWGGQWSGLGQQWICFDGLVGVMAWGAGLLGVILGAVIIARRPLGQLAGPTIAEGVDRSALGRLAMDLRQQRVAQRQARRTESRRQRLRQMERQGRYAPSGAMSGLSVQEQETYRNLRQERDPDRPTRRKYSPTQARRAAQAAGHRGTAEERVRAAHAHLGVEEEE